MNRKQLENLLDDLAGDGRLLDGKGVMLARIRILDTYDQLMRVVQAADDVLMFGSRIEHYFDGRPVGNAPSHRHKNAPYWDMDGKRCEWCASWTSLQDQVREVLK